MTKFIISTDSCCDKYKTYLKNNEVYCIILKRLLNGAETEELYDSEEEFVAFYEMLKKGALPTTSMLGEFELYEHFKKILAAHPQGDLIHLPLSSGLSSTCDNARRAAEKLNAEISGRKVFVVDSLSASLGMGMLVDRLIELRDAGVETLDAVRIIEDVRDRQQVWVIVADLFHLKRGGRLSGFKAAIGTLLAVKPIMIINDKGKLVIESTVKGKSRAVAYVVDKMKSMGFDASKPVYIAHSYGNEDILTGVTEAMAAAHPAAQTKNSAVGPIIGTHLGGGSVAVVFEGAKRLKI